MRPSSICEQCLSRITKRLHGRGRVRQARFYSAEVQSAEIQPLPTPASFQGDSSVLHEDATQPEFSKQTVTSIPRKIIIRKHSGISSENSVQNRHRAKNQRQPIDYKASELARTEAGLKKKVLLRIAAPVSTAPWQLLRLSWDFSEVYGFLAPVAVHSEAQLHRLLSDLAHDEPAKGVEIDDFLHWKRTYSDLLRDLDERPNGHRARAFDSVPEAGDGLQHTNPVAQLILAECQSKDGLTPSFIKATLEDNMFSFYILEDVFHLLMRKWSNAGPEVKQDLVDLLNFIIGRAPVGFFQVYHADIAQVVYHMSLDQLSDFLDRLQQAKITLSGLTVLHFASRFAQSAEHKHLAAKCMQTIHELPGPPFNFNSPAALSVATSLLSLSANGKVPEGAAAPDELFKMLLNCGVRPNLLNLTALMKNFCVRDHLETAWKIFDLLIEYGIQPDEHIFSILLNSSKGTTHMPTIRRALGLALQYDKCNAHVLNELLDIIYKSTEAQEHRGRTQAKQSNAFLPMVQFYAKHFKTEPLQKFIRIPLEDYLTHELSNPAKMTEVTEITREMVARPEQLLLEPDSVTLVLMIGAYFRKLNRPRAVRSAYLHICDLLNRQDPLAVSLVKDYGSLLFDNALRALMQSRGNLELGMQIFNSMQQPRRSEEDQHPKGLRTMVWPRATANTFNIVMNAFKNHKLPRAVVSLLDLMRAQNRKPDLSTWNIVVAAFAKVGKVQEAVKAMRHLELAGFQTDEYTTRALENLTPVERRLAIRLIGIARWNQEQPGELPSLGTFDILSTLKEPERNWGPRSRPVRELWDATLKGEASDRRRTSDLPHESLAEWQNLTREFDDEGKTKAEPLSPRPGRKITESRRKFLERTSSKGRPVSGRHEKLHAPVVEATETGTISTQQPQ